MQLLNILTSKLGLLSQPKNLFQFLFLNSLSLIDLITQYNNRDLSQFLGLQNGLKFLLGLFEPLLIRTIDHIDNPLNIDKVFSPDFPHGLMSSQVKCLDIDVVNLDTFGLRMFGGVQLGNPSGGEQSE